MPIPNHFDLESPAWLRNLRWAAIFGMAASVFGAYFLEAHIPVTKISILLGALGFWNLMLPWVERRIITSSRGFIFFQILVDIIVLTIVLWNSGGLVNPFVTFFILHVMIAGLLLNPFLTVVVSLFAVSCVVFLVEAPGLSIGMEVIKLMNSPIWYGIPIGLILLIFFTNGFILVFLNRLGMAQEELRQKVKMEALGRLVAGLAHEIGTPLNSILILAKDLETSVDEAHRKELSIIAQQAKRCGEIVSLLLGYSRTFVRKGEDVKYTEVALVSWLQEIYDLLLQGDKKSSLQEVNFQIEVDPELPKLIKVPELILRQALENLLKNSRDAIENQKDPKIRLKVMHDPEEKEIVFRVEDNGPGFSKEEKDRAFEAFFTTKKMGLGNGLGLYISYYLLSQVGGRIAIEDSQGDGAKIRVHLPDLESIEERIIQ
jgi:two-component system, sensor histidine kinase RegB